MHVSAFNEKPGLAGGGGEWRVIVTWVEFQFGKMEGVLEVDGGDGCCSVLLCDGQSGVAKREDRRVSRKQIHHTHKS